MKQESLIIFDLAGAALALTVAAVGFWFGVMRPQTSSVYLADLENRLANVRLALTESQRELHRQRSTVEELNIDLGKRGALPQRSPVERDLRTLARIAENNNLEIADITPQDSNSYPGIIELRYSVKCWATFDGLIGFLRDFEESSFWADIIGLKVDSRMMARGADPGLRSAEMIVVLYAATSTSNEQGEGL